MSIATLKMAPPVARARESEARLVSPREIAGFVYDPAAPERRFVVELWLDGLPVRLARAELFDPERLAAGQGDGCRRFVFALDAESFEGARVAEVRLANSDELVGAPLILAEAEIAPPSGAWGAARWAGGLRLQGWIAWDPRTAGLVRAFVDGDQVAEARAQYFSHVGEAVTGGVARAFELSLPPSFADGRLRRVRVLDENDRELPGSPCPVIAFARGLEQFLEGRAELGGERLRAGLFDRLLPQSLPASEYAGWAHSFPPTPPFNAPSARVAVALIGEEGLDDTLESLERQSFPAEMIGALPAGAAPMGFEPGDLTAFLATEAEGAEIVVFAPAGTRLHAQALGRLAEALAAFPQSPLAYGDVVLADGEGREWPLALPAFDYERMLEQGYCAFCFAARVAHVRAALEGGAGDLFRLFNFAFDAGGPSGAPPAVHAPGFLARLPPEDRARATTTLLRATRAHLEARQVSFAVEPRASDLLPAARVQRIAPAGKVSIVIPTRNRVDLLRPCLESLRRTLGSVAHEILIVDNDSADPETLAYFAEIASDGARIAKVGGPFNFARAVNAGASVASGDFLLLLNNDVEALRVGWLDEMLSRLAEPDVGAVGAKLIFPSGGVQHGGVVLGPDLAAAHAFDERQDSDPGYGELMRVAHEASAVTAACLLTPRRLFRTLGGFDGTRFPVLFNDVDYCLRLRAAGMRVVMTPHARLQHKAGASRGRERAFEGRHRHQRDLDHLRMAWADVLADDPFYSPMLGLDTPYAGLAWPPRSQAPRVPRVAPPRVAPAGF
ncbi:MAG: glycosyltransferase family 2 protein [Pseudomonadota bacterium]|nr:glycosyltransferase family 2 protein [Pseudomonadota bacterium]